MDKQTEGCWALMVIALAIALALGLICFAASMKAKAFNHATGKNVSAWDAIWIDLRVQERAKD